MSMTKSIIRQDGDGERLWFAGGGIFTMKASAQETAGAFVLFEDLVVRGKTTPMHLHPNEDETIYVLEGELLVDMNGEQQRVGQNGVFVAPRGIPHAFLVTSDTARLLCLQTPGTGESSTATPAIRSPQPPIPTSQPTSRGCAQRPSAQKQSSFWDRHRSAPTNTTPSIHPSDPEWVTARASVDDR